MKYEKLELEEFPPKQKLRMLQNAVSEVSELSYVKAIGDQDIAQGRPPLGYETYMELLLSACSTYDKKLMVPGKNKRAVYATAMEGGADGTYGSYEAYRVDTDVSDILVHASNTGRLLRDKRSG
mgnify:FL=1